MCARRASGALAARSWSRRQTLLDSHTYDSQQPFLHSALLQYAYYALNQAFTLVDHGGARWPQPGEFVAVLDRVRDLPDLRPRDPADARWPLP